MVRITEGNYVKVRRSAFAESSVLEHILLRGKVGTVLSVRECESYYIYDVLIDGAKYTLFGEDVELTEIGCLHRLKYLNK